MLKRVLGLGLLVCSVTFNNTFCAAMDESSDDEGAAVRAVVASEHDAVEYNALATEAMFKAIAFPYDILVAQELEGIIRGDGGNKARMVLGSAKKFPDHKRMLQGVGEALDNGADVNAYDERGNTALNYVLIMLASRYNPKKPGETGYARVVTLLLDRGADIHKANNDGVGVTPLMCALLTKARSIQNVLVEQEAAIDREFLEGVQNVQWQEAMRSKYLGDCMMYEQLNTIILPWSYYSREGLLGSVDGFAKVMRQSRQEMLKDCYEERDWFPEDLMQMLPAENAVPVLLNIMGEYAGCGKMYASLICDGEREYVENKKKEHASFEYRYARACEGGTVAGMRFAANEYKERGSRWVQNTRQNAREWWQRRKNKAAR